MPVAVRSLAALGVDPEGVAFQGIRYVDASGRRRAEARFADGPGRGVRRTSLVAALTSAADRRGVKRVMGSVDEVEQHDDGVVACGIEAHWLLGADGLHSTVRRLVGDSRPARARPRYGLRRHFAVRPWTDLVEVHWGRDAEAYVTPVGPYEVGVAVLTDVRGPDHDDWLGRFPALAARLVGAEPTTRVLGAGPLEQNVTCRAAGRILLVGDAAGYVDALTGEGISLGLATARAAVGCVVEGSSRGYEQRWRAATRRYRTLTRAVLYAAQHDQVRRAVVPAAAALPPVFRAAVRALA